MRGTIATGPPATVTVPRPRSVVIALASLPLRSGTHGPDVADLQRRLAAAGFPSEDHAGEFGDSTVDAVRAFQHRAGLDPDGVCGPNTWSALIEAGYGLGDRLLCLRSPMMRGDDVSELQLRLGALGFDAGRVDGIFGPTTQRAVGDFQRNAGLVGDQVCGPETVSCLRRLEGRGGTATVTGVREREQLRRRVGSQLRIAVGTRGAEHPASTHVLAELRLSGAETLSLDGEWSDQAAATNEFGADVYLALVVADEPMVEASFFSVPGYESTGGRHLAELLVAELPAAPGWGIGRVRGMRLPILRETRPPAVVLKLGDTRLIEQNLDLVVASVHRAVTAWATAPR